MSMTQEDREEAAKYEAEHAFSPGQRNGVASVACKMAKVMALMEDIPKSGWHGQNNYAYLTSDDVYGALRKALGAANLALLVTMTDYKQDDFTTSKNGRGTRSSVDLALTLICGDTGESLTARWTGHADTFGESSEKGLDKAAGSGEKSWLKKTFLVSADEPESADAQKATGQQRNQQQKPPVTPPTQQAGNGSAQKSDKLKAPAWWKEAIDTVKNLPHFAGVASHAINALNKMVGEGTIKEAWTAAQVIEVVNAKYGANSYYPADTAAQVGADEDEPPARNDDIPF